ncbi:hypothetical protein SUGI_0116330 [Cryptomeria japonica]|nr:hypothetical protein SUGI_0116330 [Cryptomeria japonica]
MSCLTPSSPACPQVFECGIQTFEYPFGAKSSGCGDPALQLDCDHQMNMTLINISDHQYYLLRHEEVFPRNHMRIVDRNMWGDACNPSSSNQTMEFWSSPQFRITDKYMNISLWGECREEYLPTEAYALECNKSWYYSDLNLNAYCESLVHLPAPKFNTNRPLPGSMYYGFRVKWSFSKGCEHCESKKMLCIYDTSNSTRLSCKSDSSGVFNAAIALGVAVGIGALLLTGVLLLFVNRKRRLSKKPDLSNVEKFLQHYVHQMPCRYSYSQLTKITDNFTQKVGEGGFGVQRNALVYEYMPNGSLDKFIYGGREKEAILNWAQLYPIALGAARGIAYLHQDCDNCIIHFDIKPPNILLDEEFTPKVADFGLAKLCGKKDDHVSMTAPRGTPGYVAPELWYRNLGPVTDKSDVYSFGMVLLELVGGRKNFDMQVSHPSQLYFPEWAFKLMEHGQLERGLRGTGKEKLECEEEEKAIRAAKVGLWCIQYNPTDRPSMNRVVQMLEGNVDVTNPPLPSNSSISGVLSVHSSEESSM